MEDSDWWKFRVKCSCLEHRLMNYVHGYVFYLGESHLKVKFIILEALLLDELVFWDGISLCIYVHDNFCLGGKSITKWVMKKRSNLVLVTKILWAEEKMWQVNSSSISSNFQFLQFKPPYFSYGRNMFKKGKL